MDDSQFNEILKRFDVVIRLLVLNLPENISQPNKIDILSKMDIPPKEIANILGVTSNTVSIALHRIKKDKTTSNKIKEKKE